MTVPRKSVNANDKWLLSNSTGVHRRLATIHFLDFSMFSVHVNAHVCQRSCDPAGHSGGGGFEVFFRKSITLVEEKCVTGFSCDFNLIVSIGLHFKYKIKQYCHFSHQHSVNKTTGVSK